MTPQWRYYLELQARRLSIPVRDLSKLSEEDLRNWILDILTSAKDSVELPAGTCFGVAAVFDSADVTCKHCVARRICLFEIDKRKSYIQIDKDSNYNNLLEAGDDNG